MMYSSFSLVTSTVRHPAALLEIVDDGGGAGSDETDIVAAAKGSCANAAWGRSE